MTTTEPTLWRWDVATFLRLADQGIFGSQRVELVDGEVFAMPPPSPEHSGTIRPCGRALERVFSPEAGFHVRMEQPLLLSDESLLLPDLTVCRGSDGDFRRRYPRPGEVVLVVEVSVSTLAYDRGEKLEKYAAADIPEVWILNLPERQVEVHRQPHGTQYHFRQVFVPGQSATPLHGANPISIDDLLGD